MSESDVAAILRKLETLTEGVGELKSEVVALKSWQTVREQREHDAAVRRAAYGRIVRFALAAAKSPVVPWICAGTGVVWATLR
jgi:hypothetical protein